jgi:two-component system cell cycle response regulator DivK
MTKRILVIEDTEDNRQILGDLLSSAGYELIEAVDGLEGVATAEREQPDLILMDIQLPEISGLEVTKWIKEDDDLRAIPVIAVTAFAMKGDEERIRQGGCEAYLSKPISVGKFIETIRHFLG